MWVMGRAAQDLGRDHTAVARRPDDGGVTPVVVRATPARRDAATATVRLRGTGIGAGQDVCPWGSRSATPVPTTMPHSPASTS
ncbi:hypothetical protein ACFQV8_32685 [Pseudonocardia benzenivorans]